MASITADGNSPTPNDIEAIFKRLRIQPANKVILLYLTFINQIQSNLDMTNSRRLGKNLVISRDCYIGGSTLFP